MDGRPGRYRRSMVFAIPPFSRFLMPFNPPIEPVADFGRMGEAGCLE